MSQPHSQSHYQAAGVDIDAANRTVEMMKAAVRATFTPQVLTDVDAFGGLFALSDLPPQPVLVASTDGVGTKVQLAAQQGRWRSLGHDIVNHCVNDILVQNARPLFFLDYVATAQLVPEAVAEVVTGVAEACGAVGCALLGGETAEMPGVYVEGALDLVGTVVGMVDRAQILPQTETMQAGDRLIAFPSSGPHTNGYSLIRQLVTGRNLDESIAPGVTLADALLAPHRCYVAEIDALQRTGISVKGLAHITGGGLMDNLPRVLPQTLAAQVALEDSQVPRIFQLLLEWSGMERAEAYRVFNMGVGMVAIVAAADTAPVCTTVPGAVVLGELHPRTDAATAIHIA